MISKLLFLDRAFAINCTDAFAYLRALSEIELVLPELIEARSFFYSSFSPNCYRQLIFEKTFGFCSERMSRYFLWVEISDFIVLSHLDIVYSSSFNLMKSYRISLIPWFESWLSNHFPWLPLLRCRSFYYHNGMDLEYFRMILLSS